MTTRTGPICLRHRRWHHHEADIDVSTIPQYLAAERTVRFELFARGIGLDTGEMQLSATLVGALARFEPVRPSRDLLADASAGSWSRALFARFPEIVTLAATLTDRSFTNYLLGNRWSPTQHALLIAEAVETATRRPLTEQAESDILSVALSNRRAIAAARGMVGEKRTSQRCNVQRALCAAAYTQRACLLRHLDAKMLPPSSGTILKKAAPSAMRTVRYQQDAYRSA